MALPRRVSDPKCHALTDGADLYVVPLNQEAKDVIDAFFAAHGDHTAVVITKAESAGLGGYEQVGPYYALKLATAT